jgi:hypothetical protein
MPLFLECSPSTVTGFIVAVGIRVAIKCLTFRTLAHIGKESFKAIKPTITNLNSSTAVSMIIQG